MELNEIIEFCEELGDILSAAEEVVETVSVLIEEFE